MEKVASAIFPFLVGVVFSAGGAWLLLRLTRRDVNGLGRKFWKHVACDLRLAAEEEPIRKAKLLHLADLIDPK
jgi:hypothetical protein